MSITPPNNYEVKAGIAEINAFNVIGVSVITSNENEKAADDINALWERFFKESVGQKIDQRVDDIIYAVYSDYEGDHTKPYRVTIGYKVPADQINTPDGLHHIAVQDGHYGVMSAAGEQPKALLETWEAIWSSDLDRIFKTDFEIYGPRFFEDGVNEVLVHIGLKEEQS